MSDEVLTRRVTSIKSSELNISKLDENLRDTYWIDEDLEIAEKAITSSETLPHAKAIQYYLTIKTALNPFGIDIAKIPFFFNYVPTEEIIELGPENEFLDALIGLHTPKSRLTMRAITGRTDPWVITTKCPRCGQTSKRVLQTKLEPNARIVRVRCKENKKMFRNEMGTEYYLQGCGHIFDFEVPTNPADLFNFFQENDVSLYYPARQLIAIIKSSIDTPICTTTQDVGVLRDNSGKLIRNTVYPKGFGDHIEMLTSAYAMQFFFSEGILAQEASSEIKKRNLLMPKPMMILGFEGQSRFVSESVKVFGSNVYVTDTSILKVIKNGITMEELFMKSIWLHDFELAELLSLRSTQNNSIEKILEIIKEQSRSAIF
jgi:hypothetical protein